MNTRDYIHPKLLTPGLITYERLDEPIIWEATNERLDRMAPVMLLVKAEREAREAKGQAV